MKGYSASSEALAVQEPAVTTIFKSGRAAVLQLRKSKVVIAAGPDEGKQFELSKARVGGGRLTHINEIVLSDKAVSGTHFEIQSGDDGYRLIDLGSTNGTYVKGMRVKEVYLRPGMTFSVGNTELRFEPLNGMVEIALSDDDMFGHVIGSSIKMREMFATLERVAPTDVTLLVTGETGTGKELIARSVHAMSVRRDKPFIVLDCGAIPKDLIESTLFGHEKGAFTGAHAQHKGCFEQADGGTIFLDEIGELDIELQPRLLRVLESRELRRVGGNQTVRVDVRVIAATNQNLRSMVNQSRFREDLFYRLSVIHVDSPPLRDRPEDIPRLAEHFLDQINEQRGMQMSFSDDGIDSLIRYAWPGNVRELRNVVERVASLHRSDLITRADIAIGRDQGRGAGILQSDISPDAIYAPGMGGGGVDPCLLQPNVLFKDAKQEILDEFERAYLSALMERNKGNITRSAQEAGLTRYHLRELLKRHHLAPSQQNQSSD